MRIVIANPYNFPTLSFLLAYSPLTMSVGPVFPCIEACRISDHFELFFSLTSWIYQAFKFAHNAAIGLDHITTSSSLVQPLVWLLLLLLLKPTHSALLKIIHGLILKLRSGSKYVSLSSNFSLLRPRPYGSRCFRPIGYFAKIFNFLPFPLLHTSHHADSQTNGQKSSPASKART